MHKSFNFSFISTERQKWQIESYQPISLLPTEPPKVMLDEEKKHEWKSI